MDLPQRFPIFQWKARGVNYLLSHTMIPSMIPPIPYAYHSSARKPRLTYRRLHFFHLALPETSTIPPLRRFLGIFRRCWLHVRSKIPTHNTISFPNLHVLAVGKSTKQYHKLYTNLKTGSSVFIHNPPSLQPVFAGRLTDLDDDS